MEAKELVHQYGDMLFRICLITLCNEHDAQDAVQETFCRYLMRDTGFTDQIHEKAWLIRVAANICRDMLRFHTRHPLVDIEQLSDHYAVPEQQEMLEELMFLPRKLKTVILLYYVEGYSQKEIAEILHISEAAVRKRMQRGREQLKWFIQARTQKGGCVHE